MWTKHTDPASGDPFYVNGETNATAWDPPAGWVDPDDVGAEALSGEDDAEQWEQHTDPGSGDAYWFHKTLGKVRARAPPLPPATRAAARVLCPSPRHSRPRAPASATRAPSLTSHTSTRWDRRQHGTSQRAASARARRKAPRTLSQRTRRWWRRPSWKRTTAPAASGSDACPSR